MKKLTFEYTDENGTQGWKKSYFVEKAYFEALYYGDKTKLEIAIRHGLPELFESEQNRECMVLILNGGIKEKGFKPAKNKSDAERNSKLWNQIHWYLGKGLPVWNTDKGKESACGMVAENLNMTGANVYRIYKKMNENPGPGLRIAAAFFRSTAEHEKSNHLAHETKFRNGIP